MGFDVNPDKPINGLNTPYRGRMGYQIKQPKPKPYKCAICNSEIHASFVEIQLKDKDGNPAKAHDDCAKKARLFLR